MRFDTPLDDPVRVTVACCEVEGIEGVESSTLLVRVDRRLFSSRQ